MARLVWSVVVYRLRFTSTACYFFPVRQRNTRCRFIIFNLSHVLSAVNPTNNNSENTILATFVNLNFANTFHIIRQLPISQSNQ